MNWEILKSEEAYKNDFFTITKDVCRKPGGQLVDGYYIIHRPDVVVVAALTKNQEIVLIEQYRHPVKNTDIEVPAGYAEKFDEDYAAAAKRELLEETGFTAEKFTHIYTSFSSAGMMSNKMHFFLALDAEKIQEPKLDAAEQIELKLTPWTEALKLLENGQIKDLPSVTALLLVKEHLNAGNLSG